MKIAVVGAMGRLGSRTAKEAARRGHAITAIDPRADLSKSDSSITYYACGTEDHDNLVSLFTGCDAVFNAIAPNTLAPENYPVSIRQIIAACKTAGVPKLLSIMGSCSAILPDGRKMLETDYFEESNRSFYESIEHSDEIYKEEPDFNWACITPPAFMELDEPILHKYRISDDHMVILETADPKNEAYFDTSMMSQSDFAYAAVDELENDNFHQCRFCVGH